MVVPVGEVVVGVYIGVLAGMFPGLVAFALAYAFKYLTDVTIPGFGVVVLAGALAGVSGGLMGLLDPALTGSWTGITAILIILMVSLWAHDQGDKLAAATPHRLTLQALGHTRLSADLADIVVGVGQVRIHPIGVVEDLEGYPPLPEATRQAIESGTWRFPSSLSVGELEERLEERLAADHDLAEVEAHIDRKGRARIAAAPEAAGLSRRVPSGRRAVSIRTLLPTGLARGDQVTLDLPDGPVTGPVVSARTDAVSPPASPPPAAPGDPDRDEAGADATEADEEADEEAEEAARPRPRPATHGGEGEVTLALRPEEVPRVLRRRVAPMRVESRGKRREYAAVGLLKAHGNRFRRVRLREGSDLVGRTLEGARSRNRYGVAVLAVERPGDLLVAPSGGVRLQADDELVVVGSPQELRAFEEAAA